MSFIQMIELRVEDLLFYRYRMKMQTMNYQISSLQKPLQTITFI